MYTKWLEKLHEYFSISCIKCQLEYSGRIPKFCMECGIKLTGKQHICHDNQ